ncbi:hypothetical protein A6R68_16127 [Neotoma lepida]|uniref:SAM domain-containing protein n=1 Tax=Neotoma lepida TaxID=56216 RepID=A0A1A6HGQ2_NEOLE|nr:hypothetical protein A6R68_16127 [Neotoma lepida]
MDLDLAVPETTRLDSSLHKARAQLLAKGRRHRPSRSRLRDSASSAEDGEGSDGPGGKVGVTDGCDDSRDASPPEPASPTIGLDKKTRRKFLDLGVTLRRASTGKSRKEKGSNRLSMGSRESVEGSGRTGSSPFLPFSWFTDSGKGSASSGSTTSPTCSPKHEGFSPKKSASQESTLSDDSTPPSSSPKIPSGPRQETKCSYPYHTLSQSSDEFLDESLPTIQHWTSQQVGQWLCSLNLEQYTAEFAARQVDGPQLLQLDGSKLKSLGLSNSHDRALVKRKLKELAAAAEKERKAQEKTARQREKLRRREHEAKKS